MSEWHDNRSRNPFNWEPWKFFTAWVVVAIPLFIWIIWSL